MFSNLYLNTAPSNELALVYSQTLIPEAAGYCPFVWPVFHSEGRRKVSLDGWYTSEQFKLNAKDQLSYCLVGGIGKSFSKATSCWVELKMKLDVRFT
jgi:hypothetical protein